MCVCVTMFLKGWEVVLWRRGRKKLVPLTGAEKSLWVQKVDWWLIDRFTFFSKEGKKSGSFAVETTDILGKMHQYFCVSISFQLLQLYCLQLTRWLDLESFQNLSTTCGSCRFFSYSPLRRVSITEVLLAEQRILLVVKETTSDNRACIKDLSVLPASRRLSDLWGQWH